MPDLRAVAQYFGYVCSTAQVESECVVVTLIYLERLIEATKGLLLPRPRNWRCVLLACLGLASKVWDDLSMTNRDFSLISGRVSLDRVNAMELALLETLQYNVRVDPATYGTCHRIFCGWRA